ncbi:MAG TPA: GAF domain-containing protein [Thermoanaerobaculia bacterium]|jgi:CheY-like chemotaxis protein
MKRIALVLEGDSGTRKLLDVLLSRLDFDVDRAAALADARLLLDRVEYDVMVLSLQLGASGMGLIERIAERQPEALARVIVLTSAAPQQIDAAGARWPGLRIIRKPFELGDLLGTAERLGAGRVPRPSSPEALFCRRSISIGAKAGLVLMNADQQLQPVCDFGYSAGMIERFLPMRLDSPYPLALAARHGRAIWLASLVSAADEYPLLAPVWQQHESRSLAAVPVVRHGRIIGAAGWSFRTPRVFSEEEQSALVAVAEAAGEMIPDESAARAGA